MSEASFACGVRGTTMRWEGAMLNGHLELARDFVERGAKGTGADTSAPRRVDGSMYHGLPWFFAYLRDGAHCIQ